jgi:D-tyrosyl-tRNA(Tyr) deacylase
MKIVLQRVSQAKVKVAGEITGQIENGYLLLIGFTKEDDESKFDFMIRKILNLKLFDDENGKMGTSLLDNDYSLLLVSQFTLYADIKKGNSPSWDGAMVYDEAEKLFTQFCQKLKSEYKENNIKTGLFGEEMEVSLNNSGPVTIVLEN